MTRPSKHKAKKDRARQQTSTPPAPVSLDPGVDRLTELRNRVSARRAERARERAVSTVFPVAQIESLMAMVYDDPPVVEHMIRMAEEGAHDQGSAWLHAFREEMKRRYYSGEPLSSGVIEAMAAQGVVPVPPDPHRALAGARWIIRECSLPERVRAIRQRGRGAVPWES